MCCYALTTLLLQPFRHLCFAGLDGFGAGSGSGSQDEGTEFAGFGDDVPAHGVRLCRVRVARVP